MTRIKEKLKEKIYHWWWLPALIGLIVFIGTLGNDFVNWDDYSMILENEQITNLNIESVREIFTPTFKSTYQPLRTLSYALDYALGGTDPFIYHLHNLLYFLLNIILVFFLIKEVLGRKIAFWSSLIFAIHPIHVESVAWIAARKEVLSGVFFFLSLFLYVKFDKQKKRYLYLLSIFGFLLALLSKPTTVVLPLLIVLYDIVFSKNFGKRIKKKLLAYIPFWIPNFLIIIYFLFFASTKIENYPGGGIFWTLATEAWVIVKYFWKLILPINLVPRYITEAFSQVNFLLVIGIIANIAILAWALLEYKFKKKKIILFSVFWFYLALIPVSNIIPISTFMADRYIYLPSLGFCLILAYLIVRSVKLKKWAYILVGGYLIFFSVQTVKYSQVWKNSKTLWAHTLEVNSGHPLAHNQIGEYYTRKGDTLRAYKHLKTAIETDPNYFTAYKNLGVTALSLGKGQEALKHIKKALEIRPNSVDARCQLGIIHLKLNNTGRATKAFKRVLKQSPNHFKSLLNLGYLNFYNQNYKTALKYFKRANKSRSPHPLVLKNLAAANYKLGNLKKCLKYYKTYLQKYPNAKDKKMISENIKGIKKQLKGKQGKQTNEN